MSELHEFFFHRLPGRLILLAIFLAVSLLFASLAGWLPALY